MAIKMLMFHTELSELELFRLVVQKEHTCGRITGFDWEKGSISLEKDGVNHSISIAGGTLITFEASQLCLESFLHENKVFYKFEEIRLMDTDVFKEKLQARRDLSPYKSHRAEAAKMILKQFGTTKLKPPSHG